MNLGEFQLNLNGFEMKLDETGIKCEWKFDEITRKLHRENYGNKKIIFLKYCRT